MTVTVSWELVFECNR